MIGQIISHYKILEKLGEGGMGVVYKAHDTELDRDVALKFLPWDVSLSEEERTRFKHEAKAASALDHPNICTIHDVATTDDGQMFIVMGYYDGISLNKKIEKGRLDVPEAVGIAIQIAEGLQAAHKKGIVHRDIKSNNIIVSDQSQVRILDFGLARKIGLSKLTKTGTTIGTASYMSPEQARGESIDHRTDLWSLGVVLYEMVTGQLPFKGEHEPAILYRVVNEDPPLIKSMIPDAPPELEQIIMHALEKDAVGRYQTAEEMLTDLRSLRKDPTRVSRTIRVRRSRKWIGRTSKSLTRRKVASWKYIALGSVILAVLVVSGILLWHLGGSIDSLAVLPFVYAGNDSTMNILAQEIPCALIEKVNGLASIRVRPRSTTLRYRNSQQEPLEIGKLLNVQAVLSGSVELRDHFIIITVEISDVEKATQLWGPHIYKEKLSDMYLVQEKIAKDVAENLKLKMTGAEVEMLAKRYTENADAYKNYLLGLHYKYLETTETIKQAISYFQRAVEEDPNYALAYAGLAEAYFLDEYFNIPLGSGKFVKSAENAKKAYELDPRAPETNVTLGIIREFNDLDWRGAEQLFKTAIELNPNHWNAHRELGLLYYRMGRFEEAESEALLSKEVDPDGSVHPFVLLGKVYSALGKHQMAVEEFDKGAKIDFEYSAWSLGWEYVILGQYEKARDVFERKKWFPEDIACFYAAVGRRDEALKMMDTVRSKYKANDPNRVQLLAVVYSYLGDNDKALAELESLQSLPDIYLKVAPQYAKLHDEPRFKVLVKKFWKDI